MLIFFLSEYVILVKINYKSDVLKRRKELWVWHYVNEEAMV